ncbi:MAG: polysaccharide deacetylase family protein [Candidatus Sericytochromatia bacterium]
MICLSADIHHSSLGTGNQQHSDLAEAQTAQRFAELLTHYGVKATFFISGRTFVEEAHHLEGVLDHPLIEIGGHNWDCFAPSLWHRFWNKATGSYNGPAWYQQQDAEKTLDVIEKHTGKRPVSWRNHMYMHGPHTEKVLAACGLRICSDGVSRHSTRPERHASGLLNFPLNIMPDHEHLYHAERTPEWVEQWVKRYQWSDDFGAASYDIDTWTDLVLEQLRAHEVAGVMSNLILHPITMYLCDGFRSAERILAYLATRPQVHMAEVADLYTPQEARVA